MARRLDRPADPVRVRLEMDRSELPGVEDFAHVHGRLSVAAFVRLAVRLLVEWGQVSAADIEAEAARLLAITQGEGAGRPDVPAVKPRGRAKKAKPRSGRSSGAAQRKLGQGRPAG